MKNNFQMGISENVEWFNRLFFHRNESLQPFIKGPNVHNSHNILTPIKSQFEIKNIQLEFIKNQIRYIKQFQKPYIKSHLYCKSTTLNEQWKSNKVLKYKLKKSSSKSYHTTPYCFVMLLLTDGD